MDFWDIAVPIALGVVTVRSFITLWRSRRDRVAPPMSDLLNGIGPNANHYGEDAASEGRHEPVPSIAAGSPPDRPREPTGSP